jgi:hypothetical protein
VKRLDTNDCYLLFFAAIIFHGNTSFFSMVPSPAILSSYECQQHQSHVSLIFSPCKELFPFAVDAYKKSY